MKRQNVAGMSVGGGRRENFFFSLLEYFKDEDRWFLTSLKQLKDEDGFDSNEATLNWINDFNLSDLIVDFPLSTPPCLTCKLVCPGANHCPVKEVVTIRSSILFLLHEDEKMRLTNPKKYEQDRNSADEFDMSRDTLSKKPDSYLVSRSFKRKLKKGFLPYWNRPLDFWVWKNYYDHLLNLFNISYESFGDISIMLMNKFHYLKRHFPPSLKLYQSNVYIALIELLKSKVIDKKQIAALRDMDGVTRGREEIIKRIEKKLGIFIYDQDLVTIVKNEKAFDSFILSVVGQRLLLKCTKKIDDYALPNESKFIVPDFK